MKKYTPVLYVFQTLSEQIELRKPMLEQLTAKCDTLLQKSSDPVVSSSTMKLATKYQAVQASAKVTHHNLQSTILCVMIY